MCASQVPSERAPSPLAAPAPASGAGPAADAIGIVVVVSSVPTVSSVEAALEAPPIPDWAFKVLKGCAFGAGLALGIFTGLSIATELSCTIGFAVAGPTLAAVIVISGYKGGIVTLKATLVSAAGGFGLGAAGAAFIASIAAAGGATLASTYSIPAPPLVLGVIFSIVGYRAKSPSEVELEEVNAHPDAQVSHPPHPEEVPHGGAGPPPPPEPSPAEVPQPERRYRHPLLGSPAVPPKKPPGPKVDPTDPNYHPLLHDDNPRAPS